VWDAGSGECLAELRGHEGRLNGVAACARGRLAVTYSDDNTARVWDTEDGACVR
jgi:WD40 repeat protein